LRATCWGIAISGKDTNDNLISSVSAQYYKSKIVSVTLAISICLSFVICDLLGICDSVAMAIVIFCDNLTNTAAT
jgi:hypothetical protein